MASMLVAADVSPGCSFVVGYESASPDADCSVDSGLSTWVGSVMLELSSLFVLCVHWIRAHLNVGWIDW